MSAGPDKCAPRDNGLGHHPGQHTRSRLTRGEGGQLRNKSPAEMGWVRLGGTVTELGQAALADGRWELPTRVDSVKLLAEIDSYAKKSKKTTKTSKKSSVTSFKGALRAIDKKYRCLEGRAPAVSPAQARIEAEFIVARRGFATLPPVATLDNDRRGLADAHSLPDYPTLRLIAVTMDRIAQSRRPQFKAARRGFEAMDALLEMAAGE